MGDSGTKEAFEIELTELATDAYALALNALGLYGKASPFTQRMGAIAEQLRALANAVEMVNNFVPEDTQP